MKCLHCEISEIMMRRQAAGEPVVPETIGRICEVIGDIAASETFDAPRVFSIARAYLQRFELEIAKGEYSAGRELVGADDVQQRH